MSSVLRSLLNALTAARRPSLESVQFCDGCSSVTDSHARSLTHRREMDLKIAQYRV